MLIHSCHSLCQSIACHAEDKQRPISDYEIYDNVVQLQEYKYQEHLPPCSSPILNPIEMVFSSLRTTVKQRLSERTADNSDHWAATDAKVPQMMYRWIPFLSLARMRWWISKSLKRCPSWMCQLMNIVIFNTGWQDHRKYLNVIYEPLARLSSICYIWLAKVSKWENILCYVPLLLDASCYIWLDYNEKR